MADGQSIEESEQAEQGGKYRKAKGSGANQDKGSKGRKSEACRACKGEESKTGRADKGCKFKSSRAGETSWCGKNRETENNRTDTDNESVQQGR